MTKRTGKRWKPRPGSQPTVRELQCLAAAATLGRKQAADHLGIHTNTLRNNLNTLFIRLEVERLPDALWVVGWLTIPEEFLFPDSRLRRLTPLVSQESPPEVVKFAEAILAYAESTQHRFLGREESIG